MGQFIGRVPLDRVGNGSAKTLGILVVLGLLAQGVARFLTNAMIGRFAGPAVLGITASAYATAQIMALLGPTSIGSAASKYVARYRGAKSEQLDRLVSFLSWRALISIFATSVTGAVVWLTIANGTVAQASLVAAVCAGTGAYAVTRGTMFGAGLGIRASIWDVLTALVGLGAVLVLLAFGVRDLFVLSGFALAYLSAALCNWTWSRPQRSQRAQRREIDLFILLGIGGTLASAGFLQASQIAARMADGAHGAGQYAAALTIATPTALIAGSVSMVLFPRMAHAAGGANTSLLESQVDIATKVLTLVGVGVTGALVILTRPIVALVWGAEFRQAETLLPIMLIAILANSIGVASVNLITSTWQKGMLVSFSSSVLGMITGVSIWILIAPRFGVDGVAVGFLVGNLVIALIPIGLVWRRYQLKWAGLSSKLCTGVTMIVICTVFLQDAQSGTIHTFTVLLAFEAAWLVVMRKESLRMIDSLRF